MASASVFEPSTPAASQPFSRMCCCFLLKHSTPPTTDMLFHCVQQQLLSCLRVCALLSTSLPNTAQHNTNHSHAFSSRSAAASQPSLCMCSAAHPCVAYVLPVFGASVQVRSHRTQTRGVCGRTSTCVCASVCLSV